MNRSRRVIVLVMLIVLAVTLAGAFMTRGVMEYLPFLQAREGSWTGAYVPLGVVDQRHWHCSKGSASFSRPSRTMRLGSRYSVQARAQDQHAQLPTPATWRLQRRN